MRTLSATRSVRIGTNGEYLIIIHYLDIDMTPILRKRIELKSKHQIRRKHFATRFLKIGSSGE